MTPPRQPSDPDRRSNPRRESDLLQQMHDENKESLTGLRGSLTGLDRTLALLAQRFDQLDERFDKLESKMERHSQTNTDVALVVGRVEVLEKNEKDAIIFRRGFIIALITIALEMIASKVHWN